MQFQPRACVCTHAYTHHTHVHAQARLFYANFPNSSWGSVRCCHAYLSGQVLLVIYREQSMSSWWGRWRWSWPLPKGRTELRTEQRSLLASVGAGPGWAVLLCRGSRHPLQTQDKKGAVFWLSKAMLTVCVGSWGKFEKMMPIPASGHNVSTITWPQIVFLKLSASYWIRLNLGIREIINYLIFLVNRFKAKAFCIIQNESRLCSI